MTKSFWKNLKRPFFALAPMEEVTDTVFRQIVMKAGRPDVFFTEFTSVEGMMSRGRDKVSHRLLHGKNERPLIAQIWGLKPEAFEETAKLIQDMGFDGIDINMGCPVDKVIKRGACSGLINTPELAGKIIEATQRGAGNLSVSVKTRIGFKTIDIAGWISFLLQHNLDALTVHFRTTSEMSKVPAHWDLAHEVVTLRNTISPSTILIGNGDVESRSQGEKLAATYNIEGIMIGRGIFHNPWVFSENPDEMRSKSEKLQLLLDHVRLHEKTWGTSKNFHALKRFFKIYITAFDGANELRDSLMRAESYVDVYKFLEAL